MYKERDIKTEKMDVAREGWLQIMIIYYHCTRDSASLLSFLPTCHPYMIFILVYNYYYVVYIHVLHVLYHDCVCVCVPV